ncbi:hypothetical protein G7Z17_g10077 [Cylindrodendrum hubeiense]|uniref:Uncharacterized protein n=1 Tax=Cylindrodendrum hubeiense TaxID=595255 RepID=A0A9P5H7V9_9HYPO|nr:hypothetical protein G7Z17_g10077 [Cylindrodendrum hubeiense]
MTSTDRPPGPLDLLATVSALSIRRSAALQAKTDASKAARIAQLSAAITCRDKAHKPIAEAAAKNYFQVEARKAESQYRINARLKHSQSRQGQCKEELELEIDSIVSEAQGLGLLQMKGETGEEYKQRIKGVEKKVDAVAKVLYFRMLREKLRYVDGYPVNTIAVHPHFKPRVTPEWSGRDKCLHCRAKRMRCSWTMWTGYSWDAKIECSRCRLHGDPCMVKASGHPDVEPFWGFADPERRQRTKSAGDDKQEDSVDEKELIYMRTW